MAMHVFNPNCTCSICTGMFPKDKETKPEAVPVKCGTCKFYEPRPTQTNRPYGECRRYAPRPVMVEDGNEFPLIFEEVWCGEWSAK